MIERIVSGAQTGVDRAALDVAIRLGYDCGGWVPKGRLDENGVIPAVYPNLLEADDANPEIRTGLNVRDSDGTIIFSDGPLYGGAAYTKAKVEALGKPGLHIDLERVTAFDAVRQLRRWIRHARPRVLNVAGPRASEDPEIYGKTRLILESLLTPTSRSPGGKGVLNRLNSGNVEYRSR
jgi:hypothetical protein